MSLKVGSRLGPYEIISALGAGGMGEVYRARDTRLDRSVAIKVLPTQFSANPDLKQRFDREARAISGLQHANICTLYDIGSENGTDYLVMEYLEGESLSKRLERGPVALRDLVSIGSQIAEALDKAHRAGIIHRDLKPGNVMLTKSGAKLLDFGLAKPVASAVAAAAGASSGPAFSAATATNVTPITQAGTIVGTVQYMSPEQVEGREADARSDIFALGCVLYEMSTGRRAFEGKTQISVASAILEKDPEPISNIQPLTPPAFEHLVRRCLEKSPDERWQSAADVARELRWAGSSSVTAVTPSLKSSRRSRQKLILAGASIIALLVGITAGWFTHRPEKRVIRAMIAPPEKVSMEMIGDFAGPPVISPDGEKVAFSGKVNGVQALWVRSLNSLTAQRLDGTEEAVFPFWSPDSKQLGFFTTSKLKKIPAAGGPVTSLADVTTPRGGSWGASDIILFAPTFAGPIYRVSANGGAATQVTHLDNTAHTTHRWPFMLADGKHFIYLAASHNGNSEKTGIYFASVDGGQETMVLPSNSAAQVAEGRLLFYSQGSLMAQKFDAGRGTLSGDVATIADNVQIDTGVWRAVFSVSDQGTLLFEPSSIQPGTDLVWVDRTGKVLDKLGDTGSYVDEAISPDGKHIAFVFGDPKRDVWVEDLQRGLRTKLTFDIPNHLETTWVGNDKLLFTGTGSSGRETDVFLRNIQGGEQKLLFSDPGAATIYPTITSDGKTLLYIRVENSGLALPTQRGIRGGATSSIFARDLASGESHQIVAPANPRGVISYFSLSPDNRWIAYVSDESGAQELYVTSYPGATGKWQISSGGGAAPAWRADGKELFYYVPVGGSLYAVSVDGHGNEFQVLSQKELFKQANTTALGRPFDPAADGQRFLMNVTPDTKASPPVLVVNWPEELKK